MDETVRGVRAGEPRALPVDRSARTPRPASPVDRQNIIARLEEYNVGKLMRWIQVCTAVGVLVGSGAAMAVTIPFTEDFTSDVSGWEDGNSDPLFFEASDGPDGGSYASADFNYFGYSSPFGGGPVVFRANQSDAASGGAFVGDWLTSGVTLVSAWVRHDAPEDLNFFMRVASSFNFPGAVIANTQLVAPDQWTQVFWVVDPGSPFCIGETVTCAAALSNVGNFQIGTDAPPSLIALDQAFAIDVDKVSVVPEPGVATLLASGLVMLSLTRRSRTRR
jgi:hypothetical protein